MNSKGPLLLLCSALLSSCSTSSDSASRTGTPSVCLDDSRSCFLSSLHKVELGMSAEQVNRILGFYVKGTTWPALGAKSVKIMGSTRGEYEVDVSSPKELKLKDCDVYRHSDEPQYNSDWGIVCFTSGKVAWVDFAPD